MLKNWLLDPASKVQRQESECTERLSLLFLIVVSWISFFNNLDKILEIHLDHFERLDIRTRCSLYKFFVLFIVILDWSLTSRFFPQGRCFILIRFERNWWRISLLRVWFMRGNCLETNRSGCHRWTLSSYEIWSFTYTRWLFLYRLEVRFSLRLFFDFSWIVFVFL